MNEQGAKDLLIYGTGGHAKVVCDVALRAGFRIAGFLDDDPGRFGQRLWAFPVLGGIDWIRTNLSEGCALILAIGDNGARKRVAERLMPLGISFATVVHPSVQLGRDVQLGEGTVVMAGVVINADTRIGRHSIINTGATVDHDCMLEDFVHIAPGAHLAGGVRVGSGALIGIGASVLPNVTIGEDAVVGAGAAVVRDLPGGVTAVGVPARILRAPE